STYFYSLVHPVKTYEELENSSRRPYLSFLESIACSWLMVVFNALIRLMFIAFALKAYFSMSESANFSFNYSSLGGHYILIISAIIDIFLFPVLSYIFIQV